MSDPPEELALAAEFPNGTREAWRKLVDGVLKGAPFDKRLVARTYDGLAIEPLYPRAADARPIAARVPGAPWTLMQRVDHPDPAAARAEALHDLENGATGLSLVFTGSAGANGYGLDPSPETIARVLDGIYLDAGIALDLQLSQQARDVPGHLAALLQQRGIAPETTAIRFGLNPIGGMAATGRSVRPWRELAPHFAGIVSGLGARGFAGTIAAADGRIVHAAGGSEAQELAFVLAIAVAYLRALEAGGVALDAARRMIYFRLAADADQFLTIAKFRSVRKLWARVEEACGLAPAPAYVAAETAWRMMTRRDPYVNMLRATIAVAAAGFGGADAITVLPFTAALGLPDRFARRIARNTQLILLEESHLAKVADPAAGSGGIEDLTQKLCATAWALFQEIERGGGAVAALEAGLIQKHVAATRAEREKNVARRKDAMTGTSEFPDIHEAAVHVFDAAPHQAPSLPSPASGGGKGWGHGGREQTAFAALPSIRLATPFEQLRDASDRALAGTGARPKIFLANLGKLADFTARTLFARNFFEAGGIEAVTNDGFASRDAMVAAFKASGATLVCLCSSDKVYAAQAPDAAKALTAAGAAHIYLAGRPGGLEAALKAAGVQDFIYVGCDVVATLQAAHAILGLDRG
jgi:methylmalonyl-CoA mutase